MKVLDLSPYITGFSFDPWVDSLEDMSDAFKTLADSTQTFTMEWTYMNPDLWWYIFYGVDRQRISKMHTAYRHKTRRRNRR